MHYLVNRCPSSITLSKFCHKIKMQHIIIISEPSVDRYQKNLSNENFLEKSVIYGHSNYKSMKYYNKF